MSNTRNYLGQDINTLNLTPSATETQKGLIEIATTAEARALTDDLRSLTPKKLADAFGGANRGVPISDTQFASYQKLPGGLILQYGVIVSSVTGTIVFPVSFSSLHSWCIHVTPNLTGSGLARATRTSAGSFTYDMIDVDQGSWFAIGT